MISQQLKNHNLHWVTEYSSKYMQLPNIGTGHVFVHTQLVERCLKKKKKSKQLSLVQLKILSLKTRSNHKIKSLSKVENLGERRYTDNYFDSFLQSENWVKIWKLENIAEQTDKLHKDCKLNLVPFCF